MTASSDRASLVRLIHRRADVLSTLVDGAAEKRELVSALAVSRSTVDRALRKLRIHAFVDRGDGGYVATLPGRLALAEHEAFEQSLAATYRAGGVLEHLPHDAPLDPALLRGAEVHEAEPPAPRSPLERLWELVERADRYRGFTTVLLEPAYVDRVRDRVLAGDIDLELVYTEEIASYLADVHTASVRETLEEGRHTMYVAGEVPYSFGILYGEETHAYLLASDEDATFKGLVLNDSPAAIDWAEELYERHRSRATEFKLPL